MPGKYRTAQGKVVDMTALASKNERTRAVGNMKVNARGDTIDSDGKVVIPVTEKVADKYAKTVGTKSALARKPAANKIAKKPTIAAEETDLSTEEKNFFDDEFDAEVEEIKAKETKK